MRIVYLHQYFNTPAMAGSTRSYEMGRRLVSFGHEVHIVTSSRKEESGAVKTWFQTSEEGIRVHWLPLFYSNKMSNRERVKTFLKFAWKASIKAAALDGDLIFATSTPLTIALPAVYAARKKKVPMIFEVRDLWPELPIAVGALKNPVLITAARWLELFAYNNAEYIIALSPGMKEGIVKRGYPADKVMVIPNSCDLDMFDVTNESGKKLRQGYPWLKDRPLVLYAGTIGKINGVDYLARVAGVVWNLDPGICFLVIGSGKGEKQLIAEAEKQGILGKNLFIMPEAPKHEMPAWHAAADMAVSLFINLKEMWPNSANKFFDALAAGRPVAINYGGWQAEILKETGAGLVLDAKDIEKTAFMLAEKLRDEKWLRAAGKAARELAEKRFERNMLAEELERVLLKAGKNK